MTLLPRAAHFALLAVLDVALHARGRPVSSRELAKRYDLPPRRLESLLQALVRAGILKSLRGPSGGYELARERRRLTMGEIVRAALGVDDESAARPQAASLNAILDPMLQEIEAGIFEQLESVTLEELHFRALADGFGETSESGGHFEI
ncbi:RrF2 family transcriptional regulator [Methylocystis heyeri]|uniref:Rrf2 family transcriptional regulator n=1 Tax=Methylocystis heyeri TaxID=391905 RepID=A0A6B8KM45_9HYPH|nr:Rrf2 family transcriptional regulator [Methylocystis heyeri]QGM47873.1 Rrf2 family transcriptional regulator [Methylocystis heyeri]